jgi:type I restriction enzyme S subunit
VKWKTVSFEDGVNSRGSGSSGLAQSQWEDGGQYPVIGQGAEFIEGWTNRADLLLAPNPAVVLYGGHTRRAKFVDTPFVPGPNVKILEPKEKLDAKFLFYFLAQLPIESRGYADHFPEVRRSSIPLPPLAEQRRIAEVLDRAEALRAKRRAALAQLDALTQSLFLDLFGDPVRHQAGKLPTVRDAISQGKILEIQDGNHGEKHPKVEEFSEAGIPFITANCLNDDQLDLTTCYFLSPSWLKHLRIGFSQAGDVLLSHKGSIGLTAIVPPRTDPIILSPQVTYYRPNPESLLPQFLRGFFQTDSFQAKMKKEAEQTTRLYLGITRQLDLPLLLPPIPLQREFARRVTAVEALKTAQRASLAELDALFATLQHRAFKGEL